MKSKRLADLVFISCFLIFLFVIMLVTVFKEKDLFSLNENRYLAEKPVSDVRAALDDGYFQKWEDYWADHAAGRQSLLLLGAKADLFAIKRPVVNGIMASNGLYLEFLDFAHVDKEELHYLSKLMAAEMSALDNVVSSYGGDFYYVAIPTHEYWFCDNYPWYVNNNKARTEISLNAFISDMSDQGVDLLLPFMGLTPENTQGGEQLYFRTDHHFTLFGAYKTYCSIIEKINSDGKHSLPLLARDDFVFATLPNPFLGSHTRKLLNIPPSSDHATIAAFNEEIPFTRTDNGKLYDNPIVYFLPNDADSLLHYGLYMGGDTAETIIDTNRDLPSILLFGDSLTNALECILYSSCGEFRSIDLRHYDEMALSEYVEIFKPDIVICLRGYASILSFDGNGTVMARD